MRKMWQGRDRRAKTDLCAGFTDLRNEKRDSIVMEFVDKLKEKREESRSNSIKIQDTIQEEHKSDASSKCRDANEEEDKSDSVQK